MNHNGTAVADLNIRFEMFKSATVFSLLKRGIEKH